MTTETAPAQDIHTAILAVMRQVGYVQKESAAGLNYTFASERALIEALRPAMIEAGITMYVGATDELREGEVLTKKGSVAQYARVLLSVVFTHAPSQTHVRVQVPGGAMDWGDKAISKALTMAYKYALRQTFVIETGDDADEDVLPELAETGVVTGGGHDVKRQKAQRPPKPRPEEPKKPVAPKPEATKAPPPDVPIVAQPDWAEGQPAWLADPGKRTKAQMGFSGPDMTNAVAWGIEMGAFPAPSDSKEAKDAHGQAVRLIMLKSPLLPGFSLEQFEAFVRPYRALRDAGQSSGDAAAGSCETFEDNLAELLEQKAEPDERTAE